MEFIGDPTSLARLYGPGDATADPASTTQLDGDHEELLAAATLVIVATADQGGLTCSPRGGAPGTLVVVRDARTLWLPDGGGRIHQTVQNLMGDPRIGLLFIAPDDDRTLRIEGTARVSADPQALETLPEGDVPARSVLVVDVHRVRTSGQGPLRRARLRHDQAAT